MFDGDGDRCVAVGSDGRIIWPDRLLMLMSEDVLRAHPQATIFFDVKCSGQLVQSITNRGGKAEMMRTGRTHIHHRLMESSAQLAGEYSGHFFYKDRWYGVDDAIYAVCRIIEGCQQTGQSFQQRIQSLPSSYSTAEILIEVDDVQKFDMIERLQQKIDVGDGQVSMIDGLRIDYANGWGIVRASNTTPAITLRFEANSEENLSLISDNFIRQMKSIIHLDCDLSKATKAI